MSTFNRLEVSLGFADASSEEQFLSLQSNAKAFSSFTGLSRKIYSMSPHSFFQNEEFISFSIIVLPSEIIDLDLIEQFIDCPVSIFRSFVQSDGSTDVTFRVH
jgi:hypothetical protein